MLREHYNGRGRYVGHRCCGYGWGRFEFVDAVVMGLNYAHAGRTFERNLGDDIKYVYWSDVLEDEVLKLNLDKGKYYINLIDW